MWMSTFEHNHHWQTSPTLPVITTITDRHHQLCQSSQLSLTDINSPVITTITDRHQLARHHNYVSLTDINSPVILPVHIIQIVANMLPEQISCLVRFLATYQKTHIIWINNKDMLVHFRRTRTPHPPMCWCTEENSVLIVIFPSHLHSRVTKWQ